MPPCVTVTEPSAYTLTAALIGGGAQSNLQAMAMGSRRSVSGLVGMLAACLRDTDRLISATVQAY